MVKIGLHGNIANSYNEVLAHLATRLAGDACDDYHDGDVARAKEEKAKFEGLLQKEIEVIDTLDKFHTDIVKYWSEAG